jgi:hypothetical protein
MQESLEYNLSKAWNMQNQYYLPLRPLIPRLCPLHIVDRLDRVMPRVL